MTRRRSQVLRVLRLLLACSLLALTFRAATPARVWTDTIVLVDVAADAGSEASDPAASRSPARVAPSRGGAPPFDAHAAQPTEPAGTTDGLVLVPDRYLRNLALLC